jgi:hypothetical protein
VARFGGLLGGDLAAVVTLLQKSLEAPEHAALVARLQAGLESK